MRILAVSDISGNWDSLQKVYNDSLSSNKPIDIIVHTGNFGFWDSHTAEYHDLAYLKQIVAFSDVLDPQLIAELNNQSVIDQPQGGNPATSQEYERFRTTLADSSNTLSQFSQYLSGEKTLPCPIYTIFGPLDDPRIVAKFHSKEYNVPNLYLVDHLHVHHIATPGSSPNIRLYGLGGNLKIHSLFDNGNMNYPTLSGKVGELWISLIQVAELYSNVMAGENSQDNTINIFLSHAPVIKTPLLEHLAIITNSDFTISQGLHFRYPIMGNGMGFVDNMGGSAGYIENYRSKFSRLRMILGELWLIIKQDLKEMLESNHHDNFAQYIELGLSLFDKIPVSANDPVDKIVPLSLDTDTDDSEDHTKAVLRQINDLYFQAYYNLWHFNLCDHLVPPTTNSSTPNSCCEYNIMVFFLDDTGNFRLEHCSSQGFNFGFKVQEYQDYDYNTSIDDYNITSESLVSDVSDEKEKKYSAIEYSPKTGVKKQIHEKSPEEDDEEIERYSSKFFRGGRGRGRGRGRGSFRGNGRYRGRGKS